MKKELFNMRNKAEKCASEIIDFLIRHEMWIDTYIYANNKRWGDEDGKGNYCYNNNWDCVFVEEYEDVKHKYEYTGDFLFMTFEGPFYEVINYCYSINYSDKLLEEFNSILNKYGKYYELGYAWSLALYDR